MAPSRRCMLVVNSFDARIASPDITAPKRSASSPSSRKARPLSRSSGLARWRRWQWPPYRRSSAFARRRLFAGCRSKVAAPAGRQVAEGLRGDADLRRDDLEKSLSGPPPVARNSPTLSDVSLKMSASLSCSMPTVLAPNARRWNSSVLAPEICDSLSISRPISATFLTITPMAPALSPPVSAERPAKRSNLPNTLAGSCQRSPGLTSRAWRWQRRRWSCQLQTV